MMFGWSDFGGKENLENLSKTGEKNGENFVKW